MALQVTQGTQTTIYTLLNGGTEIPVVKLDLGSGTNLADFGGTIPQVNVLAKGTISTGTFAMTTGTLNGGTLTAGTVDTIGLLHANAFSTVVSTGTTALGTIKAGVAGSTIYITDMIVSVGSATVVVIGAGGTSTPIIGSLNFAASGGLVSNFRTPLYGAQGSAVVYQQSVGCPLTITANGYVH
jgi:hypothetical protein